MPGKRWGGCNNGFNVLRSRQRQGLLGFYDGGHAIVDLPGIVSVSINEGRHNRELDLKQEFPAAAQLLPDYEDDHPSEIARKREAC